MKRTCPGYDVIGDVHGCYDALVELLHLLGYRQQEGVFRHPPRQAIFLGDLVDRGPKIRETLHLVQSMVARGSAQIVLGNHEINVIGFHTKARPESGRTYLRERSERHRQQITQTLEQFNAYPEELEEFIQWFLTLPLFLEFDHFRVAHACWDQSLIDQFRAKYRTDTISAELLHGTTEPSSLEFKLVNRLTRGTSMRLPDDEIIVSSDGLPRRFFRTKFWLPEPETYGDLVFQPDALPPHVHERKIDKNERGGLHLYNESEKPLFVGHYWRSGDPGLVRKNIACLDYSAVYGGRLVAYRMDQPGPLDPENLVWVDVKLNA
ncbi:MAG: metallophosphoesterase [Pseudomonadales bacterium]|nr:metallophosphoesterase [Pseudomonadales bacterium]